MEVASRAQAALQHSQRMQSSAREPAAALESIKAGLSGCCSDLIAQGDTFLHPLADTLAAQTSHKRGITAQPMSRNVSLRSVHFSLELERPTSAEADPSESAAAGSFGSGPSEPSAVSATQQASSASPATSAVLVGCATFLAALHVLGPCILKPLGGFVRTQPPSILYSNGCALVFLSCNRQQVKEK